jgi:hypothetical protein
MNKLLCGLISGALLVGCAKHSDEVLYDNHTNVDPSRWVSTAEIAAPIGHNFPLVIYIPSELDSFKQNIINAGDAWNTALDQEVFRFIFNDPTCSNTTPVPADCAPNTQWTKPTDSLYDDYFGFFKMATWNFTGVDNTVLAFTGTLKQSGAITHADILFNFKNYSYTDISNRDFSNNIDYQSVLTHELGHFLGLNHISTEEDGQSIMNPTLKKGDSKRTLSTGDLNRIRTLYNIK